MYVMAKGKNKVIEIDVDFWYKINNKWQKLIGDNARLASL